MYNELTPEEENVIVSKGTEPAFTGKYDDHYEKGTYSCRRCGADIYNSSSKFKAGCGWPSFDDEIEGAVKRLTDADGRRTEIVCAKCDAHLGHVFTGEEHTPKNIRHCVNSISIVFTPKQKTERAVFASGCFWGVEYYLGKAEGVVSTTVGYIGGDAISPTYEQVCTGTTGHAEAVEVVYDPAKVSYEELTKLFFETHNFSQVDGQGPDIGSQYRSEIFYVNESQKQTAEKLIAQLKKKDRDVATEVTKATTFYKAEGYHQDYYQKNGQSPYCHIYKKIF
jgi:peptide methionine sulfoxide reductase msrA/msrB